MVNGVGDALLPAAENQKEVADVDRRVADTDDRASVHGFSHSRVRVGEGEEVVVYF